MSFVFDVPELLYHELCRLKTLDCGPYSAGAGRSMPFVVDFDALPLAVLLQDASVGNRLYEFLTINRPGDILEYCRICVAELADEVWERFESDSWFLRKDPDRRYPWLSVTEFDSKFHRDCEDTDAPDACWLDFREQAFWSEFCAAAFSGIAQLKARVPACDDYLVRKEMATIDAHTHPLDFKATVPREQRLEFTAGSGTSLPGVLVSSIAELLQRPNVNSVSCPFSDYWIWRLLLTEQLKRSEALGLPPQDALTLSGPDSGIAAPYGAWGGQVHLPYEGVCLADLFIRPHWRKTFPEADGKGLTLTHVANAYDRSPECGYVCHYLLTDDDLGDLRCATRTAIGDGWVLYESNDAYEPNPLFKTKDGPWRARIETRLAGKAASIVDRPASRKTLDPAMRRAIDLLSSSSALLVAAGAGMSADSGLPTFRGRQGLWNAYPALGRAKLDFTEVASPETFERDPRLAWGFYGHRLAMYRRTTPHAGYGLLRMIGERLPQGVFVFTSNVDEAFAKAGFDSERIVECHGSLAHLQCMAPCSQEIWSADGFVPVIDVAACRLQSPLPRCPKCGGLARPNLLMFGDWNWVAVRTEAQQARLDAWLDEVERLAVLEIGAGGAIPTVRYFVRSLGLPVARINPDPAAWDEDDAMIAIRCGALEGITAIAQALLEGPWAGNEIAV